MSEIIDRVNEPERVEELRIVAAIDFGTSNSGVAWALVQGEEEPESGYTFAHSWRLTNYGKQPTELLVKESLLARLADIKDADLRIGGRNEEANPNVYVGDLVIDNISLLRPDRTNEKWVLFRHFKMALYKGNGKVKGSDDKEYDLQDIISLFIRCLKLTTFMQMKNHLPTWDSNNLSSKITWGVTIPTVWEEEERNIMQQAVSKALDCENVIFLLEPEGAARSFEKNNQIRERKAGDTYMIVDCGGGTVDIVVHRIREDGKIEEVVKSRGGVEAGWEIDNQFFKLFAERLAENTAIPQDTAYQELVEQFAIDNPCGWSLLEKDWLQKKMANPEQGLDFIVNNAYVSWLQKRHPDIAQAKIDDLGLSLEFSSEDIQNHVLNPVLDNIEEIVENTWREVTNDEQAVTCIYVAGGLAGLASLRRHLDDCACMLEPSCPVYYDFNVNTPDMLHGGSIMEGAASLLVHKSSIIHVAKKYYYHRMLFDVRSMDLTMPVLKSLLRKRHFSFLNCDEFNQLFDSEFSRDMIQENENGGFCIPFLKVVLAKDEPIMEQFSEEFSPASKSQNTITMQFFSSNNLHLFPTEGGDDLRKEVIENSSVSLTPGGDQKRELTMTIDFNDVQKSYYEMEIRDGERILTTMRLHPECKYGH